MKLFLDDIRSPQDCASYMHRRIGDLNPIYLQGDWYIVRNYEQFCKAIDEFGDRITHISFDHDLADVHYHESMDQGIEAYEKYLGAFTEKTGYDCALYVKEKLPKHFFILFIHSMNPVGVERIRRVFAK